MSPERTAGGAADGGAPGFTEVAVTWASTLGDPMRSAWSRRLEFNRLNGSLSAAVRLQEVSDWNSALEDGPTDGLLKRAFEYRYLRICVECANEGVHLARHQCLIDATCPRHGTSLTTQCPHCGAAFCCELVEVHARLKCATCKQAPLATPARGVTLEAHQRTPLEGWTTWSAGWLVNPFWSGLASLVPQHPRKLGPLLGEFRRWLERGAYGVWIGEHALVAGLGLRDDVNQPVTPTSCVTEDALYSGRGSDTGRKTPCLLAGGCKPPFDAATLQAGGTEKRRICTWEHWVVAVGQTARDVDAFACMLGCQLIPERLQAIEDKTLWEKQNPMRWATLRVTGRLRDRRIAAQIVPRTRPDLSEVGDALCLQGL